MKSKNFILVPLVILLACLWACNSEHQNRPIFKKPDPIWQIPSEDAEAYMHSYRQYIREVKDTLEATGGDVNYNNERLVYGAKVNLQELRAILFHSHDTLGLDSINQLYVMMGISPSSGTDSTKLIFALNSTVNNSTKYFNFTMPCPTACPNGLDD